MVLQHPDARAQVRPHFHFAQGGKTKCFVGGRGGNQENQHHYPQRRSAEITGRRVLCGGVQGRSPFGLASTGVTCFSLVRHTCRFASTRSPAERKRQRQRSIISVKV